MQPLKAGVYATLAGLLNLKEYDLASRIVQEAHAALQEALNKSDHFRIKLLVRFYADLMNANLLRTTDLVALLEQLLEPAQQYLQQQQQQHQQQQQAADAAEAQQRAEFFVYVVMATLPWAGRELQERKAKDLQRLLATLEAYMAARPPHAPAALCAFEPAGSGGGSGEGEEVDVLQELWQALRARGDSWTCAAVPRPYSSFEGRLNIALQHPLPALELPAGGRWPRMRRALRLLEAPREALSRLERVLLEEQCMELVHFFEASHRELAKQVVALPWAPPARVPPPRPETAYAALAAELLLSELLRLPAGEWRPIFYAQALVSCSRLLPALPGQLERLVQLLYARLSRLDPELAHRLAEWLAYHLSNTDWRWPWAQYVGPRDPAQQRFVREVLERMVRLSYWDRVRKTLPPELEPDMPPRPQPRPFAPPAPQELLEQLQAKLRARAPLDDLQQLLDAYFARSDAAASSSSSLASSSSSPPPPPPGADGDGDAARLDLLVQSLLQLGSKSFSHLLASLERHLPLLRPLLAPPPPVAPAAAASAQRLRAQLVRRVCEFWRDSAQQTLITLDKLVSYRLVEPAGLLQALQDRDLEPLLWWEHPGLAWDLLRLAVDKARGRIDSLRRELAAAEQARREGPYDEDDERSPEAQRVRQVQAAFDAARRDLKELFFAAFQALLALLTREPQPDRARLIRGYALALVRRYLQDAAPFLSALEAALLLPEAANPHVQLLLDQIRSLPASSFSSSSSSSTSSAST